MKYIPFLSLVLILNLASVNPAYAENIGIYFGLQGGYAAVDTNEDDLNLDDDINVQVYFGWMFTDWMGIELAYSDLGEFDIKEINKEKQSGLDPIEFSATQAALVFEGDFAGKINVFAKLGAHRTKSEIKSAISGVDESEGTDTGWFYQAGIAIPIVSHLDITLTWQNLRSIEVIDSGLDAGIDTFDLGLRFMF